MGHDLAYSAHRLQEILTDRSGPGRKDPRPSPKIPGQKLEIHDCRGDLDLVIDLLHSSVAGSSAAASFHPHLFCK